VLEARRSSNARENIVRLESGVTAATVFERRRRSRARRRRSDGTMVEASLAVGGRRQEFADSRHAAGIKTVGAWSYPSGGPRAQFLAHARPHGFVSTEFHTESGPFTQVPLPGRRSSLVWVLQA
jgi:2-octaprenyl-6-methoxyphenol hydroxylase